MTTKKTIEKESAKGNNSVNQEPIPLTSKVIGGAIVLLFVLLTVFWFVGRSQLQGRQGSAIKHFESKGFAIEKGETDIGGYPFSVKATVPKLNVTRGDARGMNVMLRSDEVILSTALWRPGRVNLKGPLSYGVYMGSTPVLSLTVGKAWADVSVSGDSKVEISDWKIYDVFTGVIWSRKRLLLESFPSAGRKAMAH